MADFKKPAGLPTPRIPVVPSVAPPVPRVRTHSRSRSPHNNNKGGVNKGVRPKPKLAACKIRRTKKPTRYSDNEESDQEVLTGDKEDPEEEEEDKDEKVSKKPTLKSKPASITIHPNPDAKVEPPKDNEEDEDDESEELVPPVKPRSSVRIYMALNPRAGHTEHLLRGMYMALPDAQKKRYLDMAAMEAKQYHLQLQAYQKKLDRNKAEIIPATPLTPLSPKEPEVVVAVPVVPEKKDEKDVKKESVDLRTLLAQDHAARSTVKSISELFPLSSLKQKPWDFSYPTFTLDNQSEEAPLLNETSGSKTLPANVQAFETLFFNKYPILKGIDLSHLLVAGGSVGSALKDPAPTVQKECLCKRFKRGRRLRACVCQNDDRESDIQDVDIFVHGLKTEQECTDRVEKLLRDVFHKLRDERHVRKRLLEHWRSMMERVYRNKLNALAGTSTTGAIVLPTLEYALSHDPEYHEYGRVSLKKNKEKPLPKAIRDEIEQRLVAQMKDVRYTWNAKSYEFDLNVRTLAAKYPHLKHARMMPIALDSYRVPKIRLTRSPYALTFLCAPRHLKLQIVFRAYENPSQVLHGFDVGPSAVGYNGENVWFTAVSKKCYEENIMPVVPTRRSLNYEARLMKYAARGFNLVALDLDIAKMTEVAQVNHRYRLTHVIDLPYLPVAVKSIQGNKIVVTQSFKNGSLSPVVSDYGSRPTRSLQRRNNRFKKNRGNNSGSDNDNDSDIIPIKKEVPSHYDVPDVAPTFREINNTESCVREQIVTWNLMGLLERASIKDSKDTKDAKDVKNVDTTSKNVDTTSKNVDTTSKNVDAYYFYSTDYQTKSILDAAKPLLNVELVQELYDLARAQLYVDSKFDMGVAKRFLTVVSPSIVALYLMTKGSSIAEKKDEKKEKSLETMSITEYLDDVFNKQRALVLNALKALPESFPVQWLMNDPGTQTPLTSSFHPVSSTPEEWYGRFYKNPNGSTNVTQEVADTKTRMLLLASQVQQSANANALVDVAKTSPESLPPKQKEQLLQAVALEQTNANALQALTVVSVQPVTINKDTPGVEGAFLDEEDQKDHAQAIQEAKQLLADHDEFPPFDENGNPIEYEFEDEDTTADVDTKSRK